MALAFSIETSCDETSVAIVNHNNKIISQITLNQQEHNKYGGVVPEIASRAHLQILQKIIPSCFEKAKLTISDIDFFCATCGPGLIGGLLVGSTVAKTMAVSLDKPFYPINHLEGHIFSPSFNNILRFPNLTILLTGGHTQIYLVKGPNMYQLLSETIDDALGETFDKTAKLLGLPYPGGPEIEKLALKGIPNAIKLPHPLKDKNDINFSFSGIKNAVRLVVQSKNNIDKKFREDLAASFQNKIIEILIDRLKKTTNIAEKNGVNIFDISVVGGVAANLAIRNAFAKLEKFNKYNFIYPPIDLCGDNAAMIALVGHQKYNDNSKSDYFFNADPRLAVAESSIL